MYASLSSRVRSKLKNNLGEEEEPPERSKELREYSHWKKSGPEKLRKKEGNEGGEK